MTVLVLILAAVIVLACVSFAIGLYPPLPRDLGGAPDLDSEAEHVRIPVAGGGELDAWVIPGSRRAVIVLFHGYARTHTRSWRYAAFLRRLDVQIVAFDFRSSRRVARKPTTLGAHEREDAAAVLDWVVNAPRFAGCRIGFHGESLGAAAALELASLRYEVGAVVADASFARAHEALEDSCERWARMPRQPSASILRTLGRAATGHDPGAFAPVDAMHALADRPVLFIHGTRDDRMSDQHSRALWMATGAKASLWIIEGAGHNEAWVVRRAEYERVVSAFFARALLEEGPGVPAGEFCHADVDVAQL